MADESDFLVEAALDIAKTIGTVQDQLKDVERQLKPIQLSAQINSDSIKQQTQQIQSQISNTVSNISKIPINFNTNVNEIKEQLFNIVSQIRGGDKGTVIDYKVKLDDNGTFDSIMLKYRNEANQVSDSLLKLGKAGEWTESIKSVSQNIEQTTKQAEQQNAVLQKQSNSISELTQKYELLKTQTQNAGINSLSSENSNGFLKALDSNNVQQAAHYLSLLRTEYQQLNAEMSKQLPQNAIDNMNTRAKALESTIGTIESKFSTITLGNNSGWSSQVKSVSANVQKLRDNLDAFNKAQVGSDKVEAFNKLNTSVKDTKKQVDDLVKSQKALAGVDITSNKVKAYLDENEKVAKKFPNEVNAIRSSLQSLGNETDTTRLTAGLQNVNKQFTDLRAKASAAGVEGRTVLGELGNDIKKMATWAIGGTAIYGTINEIKQMASNVEDLSKATVNLQIASGYNNDQMSKLMNTYSQMGQSLGATTTEVADSADSWLRQGKTVDEANQLITDSMELSKLGEIGSAEATQYITSAMKGYGVSVKDASGIVDKLTKVDMESATSAGGLAEAMSKTANAANLSGVSMDKLIGMLSTVGEVTQKSMDEVGTSFQAIFSRMGNVKAGKFVKDSEDDVNDVESVLGKVGIKLRDAQGNFRNFGAVIDEVGSKWKSYSNLEQNALATAIAGKQAVCSNIQQCIALAA